jgi:hypothetical protein
MATPEPPQETPLGDVQQIAVQLQPPDATAPGVPRAYANFAQATAGAHDVTIRFGWYAIPALSEPPDDGLLNVPVEWTAVITVPRGLVPSLVEVLQAQSRVGDRAEQEGGVGSVGVTPQSQTQ